MTALGLPALLCLIGPGYWLARRWAWPHPWISGAALSGVAWFHLVLAWDTVGGALTRGAVAGLWGGLVVVSVAVATRWPSRAARSECKSTASTLDFEW